MKSSTQRLDVIPRAESILSKWLPRFNDDEIAAHIGCRSRSVANWRAGKHVSRLSANAIIDAKQEDGDPS